MNASEAQEVNGSGGSSSEPGPIPVSDPCFIGDRITATEPRIKSRGLFRRLAGRWWQILLLWLLISVPITMVIFALIKPTYVASSLLQIEPDIIDIRRR